MRKNVLGSLGLWGVLGTLGFLIPAGALYAQMSDNEGAAAGMFALLGAFLLVFAVVGLAFYVYFSLALQTIAKKTNTANPWLAWIPIANLFLMVNIAKKPLWWVLLLFIPIVGMILVWMPIAELRQKPNWWGIIAGIPGLNLIAFGYLAWAN